MTLQEALDKLNKIKESNKNSESLRIYFPDLAPLRKIKVVRLSTSKQFILVSDK